MGSTLDNVLPKVYIENSGSKNDLHWTVFNEYEACHIIDEQRDYIEGFLDGCYKTLSLKYVLPRKKWGHTNGFVAGIIKEAAEILRDLITELLHSLVTARYENLIKRENR